MNNKQLKKLSRKLSKVLRHSPESIGLILDNNGWADIAELLKCLGRDVTIEDILYVIENNDKKRFELSQNNKIRACQGHSINIDLNLEPIVPPDILYHGTSENTVPYIKDTGILKMNRHYVHLSVNIETAINVGQRHGNPIVLSIDTKKMHENGIQFYISKNGVWLTDFIHKNYITFEK